MKHVCSASQQHREFSGYLPASTSRMPSSTVRLSGSSFVGPPRQRGIALVVALILLVVITLVGLATVRGTFLQQKMTSNFYDRAISFQSAEAALRQGQMAVQAATATPPGSFRNCAANSGTVCLGNPMTDPNFPLSAIATVPQASFNPGTLATGQPQYVVEYLGNFEIPITTVVQISNCAAYGGKCAATTTADFYRITARSGKADVADRASVVLQSIYYR